MIVSTKSRLFTVRTAVSGTFSTPSFTCTTIFSRASIPMSIPARSKSPSMTVSGIFTVWPVVLMMLRGRVVTRPVKTTPAKASMVISTGCPTERLGWSTSGTTASIISRAGLASPMISW